MGEVIARNAAADDILADAELTWRRAQIRGGQWQRLGDPFLSALLGHAARNKTALAEATEAESLAHSTLKLLAHDVHLEVTGVHDALWQLLGRPAYDLHLKLLFPRGAGSHTGSAMASRPDRIALLAMQLREHPHPRLDASRCDALAEQLQQTADGLRAAIAALTAARRLRNGLATVRRATARAAHRALANYKRTLLAHELRQAEIHTVIPAHPRRGKPKALSLADEVQPVSAEAAADMSAVSPDAPIGALAQPATPEPARDRDEASSPPALAAPDPLQDEGSRFDAMSPVASAVLAMRPLARAPR